MRLKAKRFALCIFFTILTLAIGIASYQDSYITSLAQSAPLSIKQEFPITPQTPYQNRFTAIYNNLGMIKMRVSTGGRINLNTIVFRLREAGDGAWLVENTYVPDRFIDGSLYPFGFPVIAGSRGKTYEYEISTNDGSPENTIAILSGMNSFQAQYRFTKSMIFSDPKIAFWFFGEKAKEMVGFLPHIGYVLMSLLPLFLFTRIYPYAVVLMAVFFGLLPVEIHSNMGLWIGVNVFIASLGKHKRAFPFTLTLGVLAACFILYMLRMYAEAARLAIVIPILLTAGGITAWIRRND